MARRHVDDQPPDTALAHCRQFRGDELVMPVRREWGPRVELAETVRCKAGKIGLQQCLVLAQAMRFGRRHASIRLVPIIVVITGLVPVIHAIFARDKAVAGRWMPGLNPGMTDERSSVIGRSNVQDVGRVAAGSIVCPVLSMSPPLGQLSTPPRCAAQGHPAHMSRRSRVSRCWTTSLSVGLNGFFSAVAGSALFSMSRIMSISILVARSSAEADLLTS